MNNESFRLLLGSQVETGFTPQALVESSPEPHSQTFHSIPPLQPSHPTAVTMSILSARRRRRKNKSPLLRSPRSAKFAYYLVDTTDDDDTGGLLTLPLAAAAAAVAAAAAAAKKKQPPSRERRRNIRRTSHIRVRIYPDESASHLPTFGSGICRIVSTRTSQTMPASLQSRQLGS